MASSDGQRHRRIERCVLAGAWPSRPSRIVEGSARRTPVGMTNNLRAQCSSLRTRQAKVQFWTPATAAMATRRVVTKPNMGHTQSTLIHRFHGLIVTRGKTSIIIWRARRCESPTGFTLAATMQAGWSLNNIHFSIVRGPQAIMRTPLMIESSSRPGTDHRRVSSLPHP